MPAHPATVVGQIWYSEPEGVLCQTIEFSFIDREGYISAILRTLEKTRETQARLHHRLLHAVGLRRSIVSTRIAYRERSIKGSQRALRSRVYALLSGPDPDIRFRYSPNASHFVHEGGFGKRKEIASLLRLCDHATFSLRS